MVARVAEGLSPGYFTVVMGRREVTIRLALPPKNFTTSQGTLVASAYRGRYVSVKGDSGNGTL